MIDAVQIVRDAFSALEMNVEVTQHDDGSGYTFVIVTMDGHDMLLLSVEDLRNGQEPEPTYERKHRTLTEAVEETAALPHVARQIASLHNKPPGADPTDYLSP